MSRNRHVAVLLGVVLLGAGITGCSSSGAKAASSAPRSAAAASAPAAEVTRAVTAAYETFFSYRSTSAQSAAALQNGTSFTAALADQSRSANAQKSTATVSSVKIAGSDVADVTFTVSYNGTALSKNASGKAVRQGGTWKLAAQTFCALLKLQGDPPAACRDPKVVALPD